MATVTPSFRFLLIACFIVLYQPLRCYGQNEPGGSESMLCFIDELSGLQPDSAFPFLEKGIAAILRKKDHLDECDSLNLAQMYNMKGRLQSYKAPNLALDSYFKAKNILESLGDKRRTVVSYIQLSNVSTNQKQKTELAVKARDLAEDLKDTLILIHSLNNLGLALRTGPVNMEDSVLYYYEKGLELAYEIEDSNTIAMIFSNIGNILQGQKRLKEARDYYLKSLSLSTEREHMLGIRSNLIALYLNLDKPDSALFNYDRIKQDFGRRPELEKAYYNNFSKYYKRTGDKSKAFDFFVKADSIEDMLNNNRDISALNLLEMEYRSQIQKERMAHLKARIEKSEYIRYLLIGIVLIILISVSIIFYQYKQKSRRKREALLHRKRRAETERRLLSEKLQYAELKSQHLNSQLKYTSNELAFLAAGSAQNRELLSELKDRIEEAYKKDNYRDMKNRLRELNILLMQLINKDNDDRLELINKAEEINGLLIAVLRDKFPDLSDSDVKLLILMLLKFNSKDIASIYNVKERSVVMRRYRLRQKLDMKKRETFEDFFERTLPEIRLLDGKDTVSQSSLQRGITLER